MSGTPPVIPSELQQYNSYVEDPKWQRKFTIIWASLVGSAVLFSLPYLLRAIRSGRSFTGFFGVSEQWAYAPVSVSENDDNRDKVNRDKVNRDKVAEELPQRRSRKLEGALRMLGSVVLWSPPGIGLNAGQIFVIICYLVIVLVCMILQAPLMDNPNRAGFLALAQFPLVFLFSTKNSLLSLLLGPGHGYEKLNYIHRWSGRAMFLGGLLHGVLWIRNHLEWDLPILGEQKEGSGVAAMALLCVIVLSSLGVVRRWAYEVFFVVHILAFPAFFVTICYHTIYAAPWIFPPLALYGADLLMRMFRLRIKDAALVGVDGQMTLIHIPHATHGWTAGQHVRLRVFFSGRIFESHPLTIMSAPPSTSCLTQDGGAQGIMLAARVRGDWTRALNAYARQEGERLGGLAPKGITNTGTKNLSFEDGGDEKDGEGGGKADAATPVPALVLMDGPYGGCSIDLGRYESVLLFAGGSGATFTIGLLDDLVGRCVRLGRRGGERTRRVEFAWCIRSFGSIEWFAPQLMQIAHAAAESTTLDIHFSIYVTCLCNPEAVPPIPNCDVTIVRPSIHKVLQSLLTPPTPTAGLALGPEETVARIGVSKDMRGVTTAPDDPAHAITIDEELGPLPDISRKLQWVGVGGGVGVCASGPESLTREAANAVARMGMGRGVEVGGVALHTEMFRM